MTTLPIERALIDRTFWLRWILATTISTIIGGAASGALVLAAEYRFADVTSPWTGAFALATANAVAFGFRGAALGSAQWIVLRRAIARPGGWVAATTGGWAAGGIVSGILGGAFGGALTGVGPDYGPIGVAIAFAGGIAFLILPGLLQWLVLRRQVEQAGWWVPAQAVSLLAATAVFFPAMLVAGRAMGWEFPSAQAWGFSGALAGLLDGAIGGAVLVWLLRQPISQAA
jgi:hypothetical protein